MAGTADGPAHKAKKVYLTPEQLIERWGGAVTKGTLANWRNIRNSGPSFTRLGGRIRYDEDDVAAYEALSRVSRDRKATKP